MLMVDGSPRQLGLSVIILTGNEERHIARCLESVSRVAAEVFVVDCFSMDRTTEIARAHGAQVFEHAWVNHASQFNWALDNLPLNTPWVLRLDADEVLCDELVDALISRLDAVGPDVAGLTVNRRIRFLGRWIRFGGIYPIRVLRLFRLGRGRCEERWMDEHIVADGRVVHIEGDIADINLNNISWWVTKHNGYATREAIDLLLLQQETAVARPEAALSRQARLKRWVKERVYARLPLGLRPLLYFLYRYFLRFGLLDGWPGLTFHVLQGFWYRFLVDVKQRELQTLMKAEGLTLAEAVKREYGISL